MVVEEGNTVEEIHQGEQLGGMLHYYMLHCYNRFEPQRAVQNAREHAVQHQSVSIEGAQVLKLPQLPSVVRPEPCHPANSWIFDTRRNIQQTAGMAVSFDLYA